jgi:hypothetical protein
MSERNDAPARDDDELRRVSTEVAARLATLGIELSGRESPDDILRISEAVERFESAVQTRGGDLMVDEGPRGGASQPDDPHFALPRRRQHEPVSDYVDRLERATAVVRAHPLRD